MLCLYEIRHICHAMEPIILYTMPGTRHNMPLEPVITPWNRHFVPWSCREISNDHIIRLLSCLFYSYGLLAFAPNALITELLSGFIAMLAHNHLPVHGWTSAMVELGSRRRRRKKRRRRRRRRKMRKRRRRGRRGEGEGR